MSRRRRHDAMRSIAAWSGLQVCCAAREPRDLRRITRRGRRAARCSGRSCASTVIGPRTVVWAIVNVIAACVLLQVLLPAAIDTIGASGIPAATWVWVFGVALPLLVYAFLSGGWMLRAAMSLLP